MTRTGRTGVAVALCAMAFARSLAAQGDGAGRLGKPELQPLRVAGEVVAGGAAGYAGYFAGRFVGVSLADLLRIDSNGGRTVVIDAFAYASAGFATAGAVYGVGSIDGQTGEFGAAMLGGGAGFALAVLTNQLLRPRRTPESGGSRAARLAAEVIEVLLPSIGATIGFNSTRGWK